MARSEVWGGPASCVLVVDRLSVVQSEKDDDSGTSGPVGVRQVALWCLSRLSVVKSEKEAEWCLAYGGTIGLWRQYNRLWRQKVNPRRAFLQQMSWHCNCNSHWNQIMLQVCVGIQSR